MAATIINKRILGRKFNFKKSCKVPNLKEMIHLKSLFQITQLPSNMAAII
jgi:hypothetical protein